MSMSISLILPISLIFITFLPLLITSQTCEKLCGDQKLRYPFGSAQGCGDPRFQKFIKCDRAQQKLMLNTHTGTYPITTIDYDNLIIYIQDPSMSTCSSSQPSKGFGLDWDAPFTFLDSNVFALLDCSTASSPLYTSRSSLNGKGTNSTSASGNIVPLCDTEGAPICSLLYSCPTISRLNLPISTCCVYTPLDLGPAYEMDLRKLECSSYASIYSFNGQESNPQGWKYGIGLEYKFSVKNDFPSACSICERSNGVCGYTGTYNSFVCNCVGGANTTSDCYFSASWRNGAQKILPWQIRTWLISSFTWFLIWIMF
ncbi:uncharacterized protein LOC113332725 [Papaver somniferum]|uniref:uncharacterized protein LOC113332725 n=1 Tax=Papaver somniferum TaxID=3469 RepID=UPI000E6F9A5F|nr:uncharacterized protein LOC113332725 [Papaver somniferum]